MKPEESEEHFKLYKIRWLILFLYICYSAANSFQWMEYPIITNIVMKYYNVSSTTVDWTSIIYMALYPIMVLPASYLIEVKGLRIAGILGCVGTALAAAIKVLSIHPDKFYIVLIGQAIGSAAQVFILCLPSKIAAVWFKPDEVARICALAIFGTQIGFALGFVVPSSLVLNHNDLNKIGQNLKTLCWGITIFMMPVTIGVLIFFQSVPKLPPSKVQHDERNKPKTTFKAFIKSFKKLLFSKSFFLHAVAYGINIGIFSSIGTFLNQYVLQYFPNSEQDAGLMGLFMIIIGLVGSVVFGYFLDCTLKFKEITFFVYLMSAISVIGFMFSLESKIKWLNYLALSILGFFINAYMPVGFEFGVEISFPADESTTNGILIASSQLLGVVFTVVFGKLNNSLGTFWSLGVQAGFLILGAFLTLCIPNNLKRQNALKMASRSKICKDKEEEKSFI